MDAIITASKRAIQKPVEATGDLIGNKIADKMRSISKKYPKQLQNDEIEIGRDSLKNIPKKRYISPEERQQVIYELRLISQYNNGISKNSTFVGEQIKSAF